jgi:hypothetical protein
MKKINWLFLLGLVFVATQALGQGYHKMTYQFYKVKSNGSKSFYGPKYTALMIDYGNNSGVMRIKYQYDKYDILVEQKVTAEIDTSEHGATQWIYKGSDVNVLTDAPVRYFADIIVLKQVDKLVYEPAYVYSIDQKKKNMGEILKFSTLKISEFNKEAKDFGLQPVESTEKVAFDFSKTKLHLFLVSNTEDIDLGEGFTQNSKKLKFLFEECTRELKIDLNIIDISGKKFSKSEITKRINDCKVSQDDIVVFYYSGHGFRYEDDTVQWPHLDLTRSLFEQKESYNLSEINDKLLDKKARLTIVIGECCNSSNGALRPVVPNVPLLARGRLGLNKITLANLFSAKGQILLATCKPMEFSMYYVNLGGYFCTSFYKSFLHNVSTNENTKWQDILDAAIRETTELAEKDDHKDLGQHPILVIR